MLFGQYGNLPPSITIPSEINGGQQFNIAWGLSTDPDGDIVNYKLERSLDGAAYAQIYDGVLRSHNDTVPLGTGTVAYRVKAYDTYGASSDYRGSELKTVINNSPPIISSSYSGDLGNKTSGFTIPYSVSDVDGVTVTVTEKMDSIVKRSFTATLDATNNFAVTGDYFQKILNGTHIMRIEANDGNDTTPLQLTFTKTVYAASVTLATPFAADALVTKMVLSISGSLPADANLQVLATNNPFDTTPTWEDITLAVVNGTNHVFTNTTVSSTDGVNFQVIISRGASNVGGYITSIGGAFE